jgi:hypothetical protein
MRRDEGHKHTKKAIVDNKRQKHKMSELQDNDGREVRNGSTSTEEQVRQKHERWSTTVRVYVAGDLFNYVQFVNRDSDIEYGSSIQKVVCSRCNIPESEEQEYWSADGSDQTLEVLRRRRQAVSTSLKGRFRSKYKCWRIWIHCDIITCDSSLTMHPATHF